MAFLFGRSSEITIELDETVKNTGRKLNHVLPNNSELNDIKRVKQPLFYDGESVSGKVNVSLKKAKMEHKGIGEEGCEISFESNKNKKPQRPNA